MAWRAFLTKELADLLGVLAHPHRVRIVQELRIGEMDVNSLQAVLEVSHSRVSQHLSVMKAHRIVAERRDGRHVYYRLVDAKLAHWIADGFDFLQSDATHQIEVRDALKKSKSAWSEEAKEGEKPEKLMAKASDSEGYL